MKLIYYYLNKIDVLKVIKSINLRWSGHFYVTVKFNSTCEFRFSTENKFNSAQISNSTQMSENPNLL